MKVHTTTSQPECVLLLTVSGVLPLLTPMPGRNTCDGLMEVSPGTYLVATNSHGQYACYVLEGATSEEAMAFLNRLSEGVHVDARVEFVNGEPDKN